MVSPYGGMVDAADSKSAVLKDVLVRARLGAPKKLKTYIINGLYMSVSKTLKFALPVFILCALSACDNKKEAPSNKDATTPVEKEHSTEDNKQAE